MNQLLDEGWQFNIASSVAYACEGAGSTIQEVAYLHAAPSAIFRPALSIDGNQWCALYGANLQDGVAGFGNSPELAMQDFDKNWTTKLGPKEQQP